MLYFHSLGNLTSVTCNVLKQDTITLKEYGTGFSRKIRPRNLTNVNKCYILKQQTLWDVAVNNKLHAIQPSLGRWPGSRRIARREEVVLARIRLRHT